MKHENIISIEETETSPSPSPSAASAPLREPDPPTQNPGAGSSSEPSLPPTTPDSCSLSFGERAGVREDPLLTEGPVHSPQDATRKSVGKVAHLPKEIRRIVNEMLDDGATYNQIVDKTPEL